MLYRYARGSQRFDRRERIIYMVPPTISPLDFSRKWTASDASANFTAMPKKANTSIQNTAPGPPRQIAPAIPTRLPVPTVAASAVHRARKGETPPSPAGVMWKAANRLRKKPQLNASGANRQPYPNAKNQNQHGSTPQQFIQAIQNVCHTCPPSISLFRGNCKKKI